MPKISKAGATGGGNPGWVTAGELEAARLAAEVRPDADDVRLTDAPEQEPAAEEEAVPAAPAEPPAEPAPAAKRAPKPPPAPKKAADDG